jgi:phosphogluconate 2-dehydrogenase
MKKSVLCLVRLPDDQLKFLREHFEVTLIGDEDPAYQEKFEQAMKRVHGVIGSFFPLTPAVVTSAKNLEAVATVSVGYDYVPLASLNSRGIKLTHTPDVLTETTADLGFALLMSAARRIVEVSDYMKAGQWEDSIDESIYGVDIHGKRLGIIGFGRIGQAVARRGHFGFGMPISYYNRSEKSEAKEMNAKFSSLDELLKECDFVVAVIPLSQETTRLIGAREFSLMKKDAIFVNIARGKVVDEAAMVEALQNKTIRGAGLDVFEQEPLPMTSPLLKLSNVVLTPHIGSASFQTRHAMAALAVKNLTMALQGEVPPNWVNP